jgi:hypothetical protein
MDNLLALAIIAIIFIILVRSSPAFEHNRRKIGIKRPLNENTRDTRMRSGIGEKDTRLMIQKGPPPPPPKSRKKLNKS